MPSPTLSTSERAFLLALETWGGLDDPAFFRRVSEQQSNKLQDAAEILRDLAAGPDRARARLQESLRSSKRADLSRIDPSWLIRALREESPAVQRRVIADLPGKLRETLRQALDLPANELRNDHTPDLQAVDWVQTLWTERLVGDTPIQGDDLPVLRAIVTLPVRDLHRLAVTVGLTKRAYAIESGDPELATLATVRLNPRQIARLASLQARIGSPDPRLVTIARKDLTSVLVAKDQRQHGRFSHAAVGLLTCGRLLAAVDSIRVRWGLQHLPYSLSRQIRARIPASVSSRSLIAWEGRVFRQATEELVQEGRLPADLAGGSS